MITEITIPVYNEEALLEKNIDLLMSYLENNATFNYNVTIADNGSIDRTKEIAANLVKKHKKLTFKSFKIKGRGYALKKVWDKSRADIFCYMDADLSTDLKHLLEMIVLLHNKHDVVSGDRLSKKSNTKRQAYRSFLSVSYNLLVKKVLRLNSPNDLQCGFKGIRRKAYNMMRHRLTNNSWFLDTQMLAWAEKKYLNIANLPIKWIERKESKVDISKVVFSYLKEINELRNELKHEKLL